MKEVITAIFKEYEFSEPTIDGNSFFFRSLIFQKNEYYLVNFIEKDQIKHYLEDYISSIPFKLFNEAKLEKPDIEKNTSLIICLRVENIASEITPIRNEILKIEEDDYWFKKYVIIYTQSSLPQVSDITNYQQYLRSSLLAPGAFQTYKTNMYENESYYLTMQLYLKLPFLRVPAEKTEEFNSIQDLFMDKLSSGEKMMLEKLRSATIIYESSFWDQIKIAIVSSNTTNDTLNNFITEFKVNA